MSDKIDLHNEHEALGLPLTPSEMIRRFIQGDHQCLGSIEECNKAGNDECVICGQRDCPHGEPLHYHHDGCPACVFDEPEHYDGNCPGRGPCGCPKCMDKEP